MNPVFSMTAAEQQHFFMTRVPHNEALGMRVTHCSPGKLSVDMPYSAELVGNPATGEMHEGTLTALLDATSGSVVLTQLDDLRRTATLDLRLDFLRRAKAGADIHCDAWCLTITDHVATVRAIAHDGDSADPVAVATGSFAVFPPSVKPAAGAAV
ncbi:PaaI family thioesterase [uncultured Nevskia sp.]|uniref:PaaI family thioesterase n=1 Tax=uncultured Nevskia sp. TaxID=228950 RepID=UPI0025EC115D|nr:PaaI family thioesterase [uncultured Nevskia sp.]